MAEAMPPPAPALELPPAAIEPVPEALPDDPAPTGENRQGSDNLPLLLIGLLVIAGIAAALFFARRRRPERYIHQGHHAAHQPVTAFVAEPATEAPAAVAAAPAAILGEAGRPRIELLLRPIRAGVSEDEARVEFELCVDNKGTSPAEEVRISSFLSAAGTADIADTDSAPGEPANEACLPAAIEPGEGKRIASAVTLPRDGLGNSILPVVVARARYRLPDGSEGSTSVSFAVGVPVNGELAHFDVQNPSGLHEGVEARPQGEPLKV
jgi:hypothetical protein